MKIGIVTFHKAWNYGAVLQAYALQRYIQLRGHDCEIVNYQNAFMESEQKRLFKAKGSIKNQIGALANYPIRKARKRVFEGFVKDHLITSEAMTERSIEKSNAFYDGFLFGSDQIWNHTLTGSDINYLGAFVSQDYKRNAYAASFGEVEIPQELLPVYKQELSRFSNLAVREQSGNDRLLVLTGARAEVVVDPVFLLSANEWDILATKGKPKASYIFLYHLQGKNTQLMQYAQHLAKATGCKIIEFQAWAKIRKPNVAPVFDGTPGDFINLIQNATYVITDSFHCTAFSVIFKKDFWARIDPAKEKIKSRVGNLLYKLGLQDRILPDLLSDWDYNSRPEYAETGEKMDMWIADSTRYIETVLCSLDKK